MSNEKIKVVGTNISEKATVIWNIANHFSDTLNHMNMAL